MDTSQRKGWGVGRYRLNLGLLCLWSILLMSQNLSAAPSPGQQLYEQGISDPPAQIHIGGSNFPLPMTLFPCANCHGLNAQGSKEAGVLAPAVTWQQLARPYEVVLGNQRRRPAYNLQTLQQLINQGIDPLGQRISETMPRYSLNQRQVRQLQQHLQTLGKASTAIDHHGINTNTIRIGLLIPDHPRQKTPQQTSQSIGQSSTAIDRIISKTLSVFLTRLNRQGGIFRRKIQLITGNQASLSRAAQKQGLFAILTLFEADAKDLPTHVPIISAVAADAQQSPPPETIKWSWALYPSVQAHKNALLKTNVAGDLQATLIEAQDYRQAPHLQQRLAQLRSTKADATLLLLVNPAYPLPASAQATLSDWKGPVLTTQWPGPENLSRYAQRLYNKLNESKSLPNNYRREQLWILAVAQVLIQTLQQTGRRLTRPRWQQQLNRLTDYDPSWGPAVSFPVPQRIGYPKIRIRRY